MEESIIRATASHGWGLRVEVKPEHEMEKVLYASDELTGNRFPLSHSFKSTTVQFRGILRLSGSQAAICATPSPWSM